MKRILKFAVTGLCLLQTSWALSDDLIGIYREALVKNTDYLTAEAQLKIAKEGIRAQFANLLPSLDVGAFGSYSTSARSAIDKVLGGNSDTTSLGYSANISQLLYDNGVFKQYKQSKTIVDQAAINFKVVQQNLILDVALSYFSVLTAIDRYDFAESDLKAIGRQLEQTKQRFEVGLVAITDVHEAQAGYDSALARNIVAENDINTAYEDLRVVTGTYHKNLARLDKETPLVPPTPANIDEWTKMALDNNLGILSAKFGVDITQDSISIARSRHYPFLKLSAGYNKSSSDSNYANGTSGIFKPETASINLNLGFNIYAGGAIKSATRTARYQHTQQLEFLESSIRTAQSEVRNAYLTVVADVSQVKALKQAVVSNDSAVKATEAGFEVGTRTTVDVLNARTKLLKAAVDLSDARYKYIIDRLFLQSATGGLGEEEIGEINNWLH